MLARETLASGDVSAVVWPAMASAGPQGSPDAGTAGDVSSSPGVHASLGSAHERAEFTTTGLEQNVTATVQECQSLYCMLCV